MSKSIIQNDEVLRIGLKDRFKELKLTLHNVSDDAKKYDVNINIFSLSKYLTKSNKSNLTEDIIVWLSYRYGIYVNLLIGMPKIVDGRLKMNIAAYNEEQCLKFLNIKYPKHVEETTIK